MKKLKLTFRAETLRNLTTSQLVDVAGGQGSNNCGRQVTDSCNLYCINCPQDTTRVVDTEYVNKIWQC